MFGGGARLAFASSDGKAIRIATIGMPTFTENPAEIIKPLVQFSWDAPQISSEEGEKIIQTLGEIQDWYLENAQREARACAKIIAWPETGVPVIDQFEESFLERAKEVAHQEQVYLLMGMETIHPGEWPVTGNKTVLVTPAGEVAFTYFKYHLVPRGDTSITVPGDGKIPTLDTPYGRIAPAICYDMDFTDHIRQVGKSDVDVLLAPSSDGVLAIGRTHSLMAEFRAIENGVSLVRPA